MVFLRCTQVEIAKWTSVFWYKKKDGHPGVKFAHGPVFTKIMEIKSFVIRPNEEFLCFKTIGVHLATSI